MPAIKFDVSASDPIKAASEGASNPAPQGTYKARITSIEDEKPEAKDRRLHIIYTIVDEEEQYSSLHDYINLVQESSVWKLDQFLQAVGVATADKRTGQFDPEKQKGKIVKLFVRNESYTRDVNGTPTTSVSAKPGGVWAFHEGDLAVGGGGTEDERWAEIQGLDEDALEAISDEVTAYGEPLGLDGDEYATWVEFVEAITEAMGGDTAPEEETTDEEPSEETEQDEVWNKFLGMEEEDLEANEETISEYAEEYNLDPNEYETWAELVEAINEAMNSDETTEDQTEEETTEDGEDYNAWTLPDLNGELEARGLTAGGSKTAKVARLKADDAKKGPFGD